MNRNNYRQTWEVVKNNVTSAYFYFRSTSPTELESVTCFVIHVED